VTSVVDLQKQAFAAIDDLCALLSDEEWDRPTECPGWSVKDNLSHIIGTESAAFLGRPAPDHDAGEKPWVRNPGGAANEVQVDFRRPHTPAEVLAEYREVVAERTKQLDALSEADLNAESWTPIGKGTVGDFIAIRVMDCWVHEQDIRRAVGKPGGYGNEVAAHAFGRHASAMPFIIGKKVAPPEGTTVLFDVEGFDPMAVAMTSPRASVVDAPDNPTVTLHMSHETFTRLSCGRGENATVARDVKIEGDEALGRQIVASMNFMI
jgi:uncharacterized protein (TIGR03083 family)